MDRLYIELMLQFSRVKQLDIQPTDLTHELKLCVQITRGRVDFNWCSAVLGGTEFQTCDLPTQSSFDFQSNLPYMIWQFWWFHTVVRRFERTCLHTTLRSQGLVVVCGARGPVLFPNVFISSRRVFGNDWEPSDLKLLCVIKSRNR